jgi:tRNA1(Val) A37 N6-methylase TrmN6
MFSLHKWSLPWGHPFCHETSHFIRGMASLEADNLVAFHSFSASEIWPEKRASFFYLDVNKLYNFSSKPFYIIICNPPSFRLHVIVM